MSYAEDFLFNLLYCRDVETVGCCEGIGHYYLEKSDGASLRSGNPRITARDFERLEALWNELFSERENEVVRQQGDVNERQFLAELAKSLTRACTKKTGVASARKEFQEAARNSSVRRILANHDAPGLRAKLLSFCIDHNAFWLFRLAASIRPNS